MISKEIFTRDSRWDIFYGQITLEEFISDKVPQIRFHNSVSEEIKQAFSIIHKLLIHSYYEYLFVDISVLKALHTLEMALKIRYKETTRLTWKKAGNFEQLLNWFRSRDYFERNDENFFKYVRDTRNLLTHPSGFNTAGGMYFPWINTCVDLINDIYENISVRRDRWLVVDQTLNDLRNFTREGAKLSCDNKEHFIYDCGPVIVNNFGGYNIAYITLYPLFDTIDATPKFPLIISIPLVKLNLTQTDLCFVGGHNNTITLTNKLSSSEKDAIVRFRTEIVTDIAHVNQHSSFLYDSNAFLIAEWRKFRFETRDS